jgi:hypothetical protein
MHNKNVARTPGFCKLVGLHPLVAFALCIVDAMLFGEEVASLGAGWLISVPIALALSVPCTLIQRYSMRDTWGIAISKGMIVGILTAIPTALPSIFTAAGGLAGLASISLENARTKRLSNNE